MDDRAALQWQADLHQRIAAQQEQRRAEAASHTPGCAKWVPASEEEARWWLNDQFGAIPVRYDGDRWWLFVDALLCTCTVDQWRLTNG